MSCAVQNREQGLLEIKNNDYEADSFFRLNFKVFIGVDNSERARARDKKCKEDQFRWRIAWKFYSGCEKMRKWEMLAATKVKMSGSKKKVNRTTYNISAIKRVTGKFLGVSRCRRAKQW